MDTSKVVETSTQHRKMDDKPSQERNLNNIISATSSSCDNSRNYRFYTLDFQGVDRKTINPYKVREEIKKHTGEYPLAISGDSRSRLTIEVRNANQARKITSIMGTY